jgi:hypothetical protein
MGLDQLSSRADYRGCALLFTLSISEHKLWSPAAVYTPLQTQLCTKLLFQCAALIRRIRYQRYLMCTVGVHAWALFLSSEVFLLSAMPMFLFSSPLSIWLAKSLSCSLWVQTKLDVYLIKLRDVVFLVQLSELKWLLIKLFNLVNPTKCNTYQND